MVNTERSRAAMQKARTIIPGGVNSPVRAFGGVGGDPIFMARGEGPYLWDVDGNRYIDYVGSWGPAIVGHSHPEVVEAIKDAVGRGISFGAPTEAETALATTVRELFPSMEMLRLVSSGTEACMAALRVARAFTKREKIIKFEGCYHGHADLLLVKAGSGALTFGLPDSPGVPADTTRHTLVAPYNDLEALRQLFREHAGTVAAVILEPIVGNAGFIRPTPEFLGLLRQLTSAQGTLLIFDEVMTGLRVGLGGAQALFGIQPDLTTLGKVIGGGMPLAAYGGRKAIMELVAPSGPVYQAGTLSGNPVAVACGQKTIEILRRPGVFNALSERTKSLCTGLATLAKERSIPLWADSEGGMFGFFFRNGPVRSLSDARGADANAFRSFFHAMLARGVYLAPSAFEAGFVSTAHTSSQIDETLAKVRDCLRASQ